MLSASTILRRLLGLLFISLAVAACAAGSNQPDVSPAMGNLEKARAAENNGNYATAAREYHKLAAGAAGAAHDGYLLDAASALVHGNYLQEAALVLRTMDQNRMAAAHRLRWQNLTAMIALNQRNPQQALETLKDIPEGGIPPDLLADAHKLRSKAYMESGNFLEAAHERTLMEPWLNDDLAIRENRRVIWQTLTNIPEATLAQHPSTSPDVFSGWVELAGLVQAQTLGQEIASWQTRYPQHPATEELVDSLLARAPIASDAAPKNIAVLLPQSGPYAKSAVAIRDGFLAAYMQRDDRSESPAIRLYDTGAETDGIINVYTQAIEDGADFVVGPLTKEAVNTLLRGNIKLVPTLALNYAEPEIKAPSTFYQFGLSPEDEARQVAERAWLDGRTHALVFAPEDDWGKRVYAAFSSHWEELGGKILESKSYTASQKDFSEPLRGLLNIDESEARYRALKTTLGGDIKFEPRRRQDADFIFMIAFPNQARAIRPQLKFFYASDLPVYTTSHAYSGKPDPSKDHDMDGIMFEDMPWTLGMEEDPLRDKIIQTWPDPAEGTLRLYALGVDAYRLIARVKQLRSGSADEFSGATGRLSLDQANRIHRSLQWARFVDGKPKLLQQHAEKKP